MNLFKDQITSVKNKTDNLISEFTADQWCETVDVVNTNLNWQIGHIILANYLHGIASISGKDEVFNKKVNVPDYIKFYGPNSNPSEYMSEKPSGEALMEVYELTFYLIFKGLENMTLADLECDTSIPNPSVQTKYQAMLWLSQHQSWHCGQIAILKRLLN